MNVRVYKFGCRPPREAEVGEHFYRANRYRNDLCAIERRRREKVMELQRRHFPRIGELEAEAEKLDAEREAVRASIRKENAENRNRRVAKETKAQVDALSTKLKTARDALKAEKSAAFGPDEFKAAKKAYRMTRDRLREETKKRNVAAEPEIARASAVVAKAEGEWIAAVPQARAFSEGLARIERDHDIEAKKLYANAGVHSGTKLAVMQATEKFRAGAPPAFKRYRGDGKVGVQPPSPGVTVRDALDATQGQIAIDGYNPNIDGAQLANVRFRIGSEKVGKKTALVWANVPTKFHRPIPEDAKIKWVYLNRHRVGTQYQHTMQFTLDRANERWAKPNMADRGIVAVDVGWRLVPGGLRAAYWAGNDGRFGEIVLPERIIRGIRRSDEIHGARDIWFNAARDALAEWYKRQPAPPEWLVKRVHKIDGEKKTLTLPIWKSPARLAGVVLGWRDNRIAGDDAIDARLAGLQSDLRRWHAEATGGKIKRDPQPGIYGLLESWRAADKVWMNIQEHGRQKHIGHRDEIYKVFAAKLRTEYRTVIVEKVNWRKMQEKKEAENDVGDKVVGHFRIAAVGRLIEILSASMGETVRRDPKDTSAKCPACGELSGEANPANLMHTCAKCMATYDQDRGAALNLLGEHRGTIKV